MATKRHVRKKESKNEEKNTGKLPTVASDAKLRASAVSYQPTNQSERASKQASESAST